MSVNIQLEWTPNPSTLEVRGRPALLSAWRDELHQPGGRAEEKSPLAPQAVRTSRACTAVMLGTNFVTVTKGDEGEWDELNDG